MHLMTPIKNTVAVLIVAGAVVWALDILQLLALSVYKEQYMSFVLGLTLAAIYLPAETEDQTGRTFGWWFGVVAAILGFVTCGYLAVMYPVLLPTMIIKPMPAIICGAVLIPLMVEALRRVAGLTLCLILVAFLFMGLFAHYLPGLLEGRQVRPGRLISYLMIDPNGILGLPLLVTSTIVVSFVLFGNILNVAGGGAFFTDLSLAAMGRFRGGTAKIAIAASALFGSVSGSAVANVASTGVITIPMMKKSGYSPSDASAIEASASTGGQLLPPVMGAVAFLMAEFLNVPYAEVALAALIPGLLYYTCLFIQADLLAARNGITALKPADLPRAMSVLVKGGHYIIPFAVLVTGLFKYNLEAERAVAYATAVTLFLGALRSYGPTRLTLRGVFHAVVSGGRTVADIIIIGACAGAIIGVLNITAVSFGLTLQLVSIGESSLFLLLITAAILSIIMGMGLPTLGVYLLLATLTAPSLVELGLTPISAHMFIFFFGMMSLITPPIAVAAFAAANIGGAPPMKVGWKAVQFSWPAFVLPFLFVYSPSLLMMGDPWRIVVAVATAVLGVALISSGLVGYASRRLLGWERMVAVLAGACFLLPDDATTYGIWINLAGLPLLAFVVLRLMLVREIPGLGKDDDTINAT